MGDYDFTNAADGTRLSVSLGYLDDLEKNIDAYDLVKQAPRLRTPHLIVHGATDLAVDVECARVLYDAEKNLDDKRLLIARTGHLFGVAYPVRDVASLDSPSDNPDGHARGTGNTTDAGTQGTRLHTPDKPADVLVKTTDATVKWFTAHLGKGA